MSAKPPVDMPESGSAIERLLRAVSPSLEAEVVRLMAEQKERLGAEANVQLRKALLEKDAEWKTKAEGENTRLRAETTERVRQETIRELEAEFETKLSAELRTLKDRLDEARREAEAGWDAERAGFAEEVARWRVLAEFHGRTSGEVGQVEILNWFLEAAHQFAGGAALYLDKAGGLARWGSGSGDTVFPELVSEDTKDPDWYWAPIKIRSRTVVTVAVHQVKNREALDALVNGLTRAIEGIGLRLGARAAEPGLKSEGAPQPVTDRAPEP